MPDQPVSYAVPVPDPTTLTTEQLRREIAWTREITDQKFAAFTDLFERLEKRVEQRGADIVVAVQAQQDVTDQRFNAGRELSDERMSSITRELALNRDQTDEKFEEIDVRLTERDVRFTQAAEANERAITAALTSVTRELALAQLAQIWGCGVGKSMR